jgi:hypothetical protein
MFTIAARGDFTIEKYWEEGGMITFEYDYSINHELDIFDFDSTFEGIYTYNGSLSTGELVYNLTYISPAEEKTLTDTSVTINPHSYNYISISLEEGDAVDYFFTVNGGYINFIIFNTTQFSAWIIQNETQPIESVELIHTNIDVNDTFTSTSADSYKFVWWNNGDDDPLSLQIRLYARLVEIISSEFIEIDPTTLETTEGEEFTLMGMDTSDWEIGNEISFEIDGKDVELTIVRDNDFQISYNDESTKIPCWVLEIEDYETEMGTISSDLKIWKSKYSGITLKSITDSKVYDSNSEIIMETYDKITAESAYKVLLIPKSSGVIFPITPAIIALLVIFRFKKKGK